MKPCGFSYDASFFLVLMIVSACPTSNSYLVMCEVAGQDKTAISASIFLQYLCAPVLLGCSVTVFLTLIT
jgi:hypothetical protein